MDSGGVLSISFLLSSFGYVIRHSQFTIRRAFSRRIRDTGPYRSNNRYHDHGIAHRIAQGIPQRRPGRHVLPLQAQAH